MRTPPRTHMYSAAHGGVGLCQMPSSGKYTTKDWNAVTCKTCHRRREQHNESRARRIKKQDAEAARKREVSGMWTIAEQGERARMGVEWRYGDVKGVGGTTSGKSVREQLEATGHPLLQLEHRFHDKVDLPDFDDANSCWVWKGTIDNNCPRWGIYKAPGGESRSIFASRIAWFFTTGVELWGLRLVNICGKSSCVRPSHHKPLSPSQMTRRLHKTGAMVPDARPLIAAQKVRMAAMTKAGRWRDLAPERNRKVTPAMADAMYQQYLGEGVTHREVALAFGVSAGTVQRTLRIYPKPPGKGGVERLYTLEQLESFYTYKDKGMDVDAAAVAAGIHPITARNISLKFEENRDA